MWGWFITNGVWILVAVAVGSLLFLLLRRWAPHAIEKVVPKQWQEQLKGTPKNCQLIIRIVRYDKKRDAPCPEVKDITVAAQGHSISDFQLNPRNWGHLMGGEASYL